MEVNGRLHAAAALPPGKNVGDHKTGGWVGPRAGLDALETDKSVAHTGIRTRNVQPGSALYWLRRPACLQLLNWTELNWTELINISK
jgi:hypothetical protein